MEDFDRAIQKNPSIISTIKNVARDGMQCNHSPQCSDGVEHAIKITGAHKDTVNKHFHEVRQEKERGKSR